MAHEMKKDKDSAGMGCKDYKQGGYTKGKGSEHSHHSYGPAGQISVYLKKKG